MYYPDVHTLSKALDEIDNGLVLLLAGEKDFDFEVLKPIIASKSFDIVGAFFPGVIYNSKVYDSGFVLIHSSAFNNAILMESDVKNGFNTLPKTDYRSAIVITQGVDSTVQNFFAQLSSEIELGVPLIGFGAGSSDLSKAPCIFSKDGIFSHKVVFISMSSNLTFGLGHGFKRILGPYIATRVNSNVIKELNWENASKIYVNSAIEELGESQIDLKKDFASHPLGVSRHEKEDIVRDILSFGPKGELMCLNQVPENAALYVLGAIGKDMLLRTADIVNDLNEQCTTKSICLEIIVQCISRRSILKEDVQMEVDLATTLCSNETQSISNGVVSIGEITYSGYGQIEIHNKTIVVGKFYE